MVVLPKAVRKKLQLLHPRPKPDAPTATPTRVPIETYIRQVEQKKESTLILVWNTKLMGGDLETDVDSFLQPI
jgi:hypothetical protein